MMTPLTAQPPVWSSLLSFIKWAGIPGTVLLAIVLGPYVRDFLGAQSSDVAAMSRIEATLSTHTTDEGLNAQREAAVDERQLELLREMRDHMRAQTAILRMLCRDQVDTALKPRCDL